MIDKSVTIFFFFNLNFFCISFIFIIWCRFCLLYIWFYPLHIINFFYVKINNLPVIILLKASSTFVESMANVSIKAKLFYSANLVESSTFTTLWSYKSDLLPTNITTIFGSACSFNSLNHFYTLLKVPSFVISYNINDPTAPL